MDTNFTFSEETWTTLSRLVAEAHRLSVGELDRLRINRTAKLITAIPYIAGCDDADRIAVQHLSTYLLAQSATSIFDHRAEDDSKMDTRLERISHFTGGDPALIRRGMALLELTMVCGYEHTKETDKAQGVYNPLVSEAWDEESTKARLVKEIRSVDSAEMDAVFDVERALVDGWNS